MNKKEMDKLIEQENKEISFCVRRIAHLCCYGRNELLDLLTGHCFSEEEAGDIAKFWES